MKFSLAVPVAIAIVLSACFAGDDQDDGGDPAAGNASPSISGTPPTSIVVGATYSFTPNASDPDGDTLTFSITNKPSWAQFNTTTGRLSGTVQQGDVGIVSNIRISVSDGKDQATLGSFSIAVNQIALGSATLSWVPPTQNDDGTALTDLAGYRIYYGTSANSQNQVVELNNAGLTRYVIENLSPARWYFSMTAVNSSGAESNRSGTGSKTVT